MASNAMHKLNSEKDRKGRPTIFGTDGIRGEAGKVLTPELVLQIGYFYGISTETKGPVLIGQDSRNSSEMMVSALTAGLMAAGNDVWSIGLCSTPAVAHLIKEYGISGGLMVSASHNPPEDNGIKFFGADGNKISYEKQKLIEEGLKKNKYIGGKSAESFERHDLLTKYEDSLIKSIQGRSLKGVSIVLDLCWGSATACGEKVFKELGADLTIINGKPDGSKINVGCGSTNLEPLKKAVKEKQAQMGFAFDGDADRMMAIDERGRVMNGDHVLYLWGSALKAKNELPDTRLVATMMSNLGFEKAWTAKGGILDRTPVGDQHVQAAMIATKAGLGGEQSGHILSTINGLCGDGLLTSLQIASICNAQNLRLSEWLDQSFTAYPQKLINIPLIDSKNSSIGWENSELLKDELAKAKLAMGDEGRIYIRESGTEPLLRIMVESKQLEIVNKWSSRLAKVAKSELRLA